MGLILSDDQLILKETARSFLAEKSPVSRMRELRDSEDATGFSRSLWKEMAEMGWAGILFPEEYGGAGMAHGELAVVLEECGRVLAPEPFMSTVLLGTCSAAARPAQTSATFSPMSAMRAWARSVR